MQWWTDFPTTNYKRELAVGESPTIYEINDFKEGKTLCIL